MPDEPADPAEGAGSDLAARLRAGDRHALARAITLSESTRADHRERAERLLGELMPATGGAHRIGITGPPGAGKSSFIEAFGLRLVQRGDRPAVLAVDPSSRRTGGSVLGDKTRMELLSQNPLAYIRPSPAGRERGGVGRRTQEAILFCEAAGFTHVIVETVGVGQSEVEVADLVDQLLLLLAPGGGDDLQAMKRGILEEADLVVVNKADGGMEAAARRLAAACRQALGLLRPRHPDEAPVTLPLSVHSGRGLDEVAGALDARLRRFAGDGRTRRRRAEQAKAWLWRELRAGLEAAALGTPGLAEAVEAAEAAVAAGQEAAALAARRLLGRLAG